MSKLKKHYEVKNGRRWPKALCGNTQLPMTTLNVDMVTCIGCNKAITKLLNAGTHRRRRMSFKCLLEQITKRK